MGLAHVVKVSSHEKGMLTGLVHRAVHKASMMSKVTRRYVLRMLNIERKPFHQQCCRDRVRRRPQQKPRSTPITATHRLFRTWTLIVLTYFSGRSLQTIWSSCKSFDCWTARIFGPRGPSASLLRSTEP